MEDKGLYDVLMVKYLAGELSLEEDALINEWLEADDRNKQDLEASRKTWRLLAVNEALEKTDVSAEWNRLKKVLEIDKARVISISERQGLPQETAEEIVGDRSRFRRLFIRIAVAASLIFLMILGGKFLFSGEEKVRDTVDTEKATLPLPVAMRHEENRTVHNITYLLNDGSTIVLFPNSQVHFRKDFPIDKRDIVLAGKAQFIVAHDKARPFTVFSGDISTTALGTKFSVTAFEDDNLITVRLDEGKVVVRPVNKRNPAFDTDFILVPGQQLIYNKLRKTVTVKAVKAAVPVKKNLPETNKNQPEIPNDYKGSWFMFNNEPLTNILETLEEMYNAKIIYSRKDMQKLYFIGRFNKSDSLQDILQHIATLNNLSLTKDNNSFILKRNE